MAFPSQDMVDKRSRYPEEVVVSDVVILSPADGTDTPSEPNDDFFSSWDKPSIKRPSNPPSRTQTPPVVNRTASPFLSTGVNGTSQPRSKSPLNGAESDSQPTSSRPIQSAAVRKPAASTGPRKANILGAKKTQKLGAKKVGGPEAVDFEAAERKAKEEAERIAKLGYDPDAEEAEAKSKVRSASISDKTRIAAPTPVNPARPGPGAGKGHERTKSEMERLGMGMGRLGFGQVGSSKPAAAPKKMGFGSTGSSRAVEEGMILTCFVNKTGTDDLKMTTNVTPAKSSAPKKAYLAMNFLGVTILIQMLKQKPNSVCKALTARRPFLVMPTLVARKMKRRRLTITAIMETWKVQLGIL